MKLSVVKWEYLKMNICMISPFSVKAPSSFRLLSFSRALQAKGHTVTLILPRFDRHSGYTVEKLDYETRMIHPFQLKTGNLVTDLLPYELSAAVSNNLKEYDIVHILKPTPITAFGYSAKFLKIPIVIDIDDLDHLVMRAEKQSYMKTWLVSQSEKLLPKLGDSVVVSCSSLQQYYCGLGVPPSRISQISNGVSVKDFQIGKNLTLKSKYNLKDKVIIYVGSLNNYAQLLPLINSMQRVVTERLDVSCLIVGDGTARDSLKLLVSKLNIDDFFVFTGRISHDLVPQFLSLADIGFACFPSLDYFNYASNIKVFEYMAAGLPVIVSPTGDLPFYIDYGKAGVVSKPEADHLSKKLISLLEDESNLKQLSANARKQAMTFDWITLTDKLLDVYEQLVN